MSSFNRFSSVTTCIFLPTCIVAQILSFRAFSSPNFLLQKSFSFGSSSLACCVLVSMFLHHIIDYFELRYGKWSFFFCFENFATSHKRV
jgi:magnesium-transporting ATPase (P-type)